MSAGKEDEGKRPGFKVSDRRSFVEQAPAAISSEPTQAAPEPAAVNRPAEPATEATAPQASDAPAPESSDAGEFSAADALPPVDFHTFILSLGSSALLHLGELDHPDGRESRPNLRLAKHTIDIIGMLQEKTRGNLSAPEERLIESLLYDLRLRYVERGQKSSNKT